MCVHDISLHTLKFSAERASLAGSKVMMSHDGHAIVFAASDTLALKNQVGGAYRGGP